MRFLRKAYGIARTHGAGGFVHRVIDRWRRHIEQHAAERSQDQAWLALAKFPLRGPVNIPFSDAPLVTIAIHSCRDAAALGVCLNAIASGTENVPYEVIVFDDSPQNAAYIAACSGVRFISSNGDLAEVLPNLIRVSRGRYVHLMGGDVAVQPGWLPALVETLEMHKDVGAVGSQLRAPDGTVLEAGGIVWGDGSAESYGVGKSPCADGVAHMRDVDYCSSVSLLLRADVLAQIRAGSPNTSLGAYADVDLCFRIKSAGYRVVYQPYSVAMQRTPQARPSSELFMHLWENELRHCCSPQTGSLEGAARRGADSGTILVMDSFVPFADRSAGARRIFAIMGLMRALRWNVIFVADDGELHEPYTARARAAGIEVIPHRGDAVTTLRSLPVPIDIAWISRPGVLKKYLGELRSIGGKIIYDTVDLHFVRLKREQAATGRIFNWEEMQTLESGLAKAADWTIVTTENEHELLRDIGIKSNIIPIVETPISSVQPFSARSGVLFLANYSHAPNIDAAIRLVNDIMPLVWQRDQTIHVTLAGAEPTQAVRRLAGRRVRVTGFVEDAAQLFESAVVFAAPLRFGAGMKGKIVQSIAYGLPVVTTPVGAEGIGLRDEQSVLIREEAQAFATAILRICGDSVLWGRISAGGYNVSQFFAPDVIQARLKRVLQAVHSRTGSD